MKRRNHVLVCFLAAAPLIFLGLMWAPGRGVAWWILVGVIWVAGVVLFETFSWRASVVPLGRLLDDLDVDDPGLARRSLEQLRQRSEECEQLRRETSELLEDLSSSLGDGLLVVASDLSIRMINPVALRFCDVESAAPNAHLLEITRHPDVVNAVEAAAAGGGPDPVVVENPRGLWEVHAFPVRGGGAVVLFSDIGLVRRAAEFRRRFVQDLSHELRSPLTVLRTTVEALEDEVEPGIAAMLVRQVERIDRLTAELYELASIEAGEIELQLESISVSGAVREVFGDFEPEAQRMEVEFRFDVEEGLSCWCDRRGLYRVLSNLVDNAVKYNRKGGWVQARAKTVREDVEIEISDSGEGIPASELKAVLQRFYRVDRARTPGDGGLGLGLAIVKHMVQALGGSLELDSREGVGTAVKLRFPTS